MTVAGGGILSSLRWEGPPTACATPELSRKLSMLHELLSVLTHVTSCLLDMVDYTLELW